MRAIACKGDNLCPDSDVPSEREQPYQSVGNTVDYRPNIVMKPTNVQDNFEHTITMPSEYHTRGKSWTVTLKQSVLSMHDEPGRAAALPYHSGGLPQSAALEQLYQEKAISGRASKKTKARLLPISGEQQPSQTALPYCTGGLPRSAALEQLYKDNATSRRMSKKKAIPNHLHESGQREKRILKQPPSKTEERLLPIVTSIEQQSSSRMWDPPDDDFLKSMFHDNFDYNHPMSGESSSGSRAQKSNEGHKAALLAQFQSSPIQPIQRPQQSQEDFDYRNDPLR